MGELGLRRHPERGHHDRETVDAILDAGFLCHVGFAVDGQPYVIPMLHARVGDVLYLHGSPASRLLRQLGAGEPVCVTVTHVDGIVLAKSVFNHSVNYRSAVVLGTARVVEGEEKLAALEAIVEHVADWLEATPAEPASPGRETGTPPAPLGRWSEARQPNAKELRTTEVVAVALDACSAKIRTGPPKDAAADEDLDVPTGVIPIRLVRG